MQERAIARRKEKLTGISEFPNLSEWCRHLDPNGSTNRKRADAHIELALPAPGKGERFAALVAAAVAGATLSDLRAASRTVRTSLSLRSMPQNGTPSPLRRCDRWSDVALSSIGSRPPVFLAALGKTNGSERANWVQGFFAAGGIEVVAPAEGFDNIDALVAAFKQSPAPAACLCASNTVYGAIPGAAAALKKAGAVLVYLAGPASILKTLDAKDKTAIDRLIYEG